MHKESYTTDSWGVGLTLNTFDHEQCFTDGISIETTSPTSESSSPSNVPSASWLPCKDYSSYSSSWDHYSSLYDYGFTFNDTLACPVDDDSYGPLDVEINGITIGSVLFTKLYVSLVFLDKTLVHDLLLYSYKINTRMCNILKYDFSKVSSEFMYANGSLVFSNY